MYDSKLIVQLQSVIKRHLRCYLSYKYVERISDGKVIIVEIDISTEGSKKKAYTNVKQHVVNDLETDGCCDDIHTVSCS